LGRNLTRSEKIERADWQYDEEMGRYDRTQHEAADAARAGFQATTDRWRIR
jgi:hypothetical protein